MTFVLPFAIWTLRGFILGIPRELEEAAMVDGSSRIGAFVRILLPLVAPGLVATSVFVFITVWNEFIFANVLLTDQSKQTLTLWLAYFYGTSRNTDWGGLMAGVDADRDPGDHLLPDRAAEDRLRADGRRRQGVSAGLERLASACLFPGFEGLSAPDWLRRELDGGLGGVVLFSRNVGDRAQLAALSAEIRAENADALIGIDEEGGDVTRLEASTGSSYPGNLALGAVDDVELTERVAAAIGGELAACGVNLDLAPVADVNSDELNPIIGVRSFGSDPGLVARHVAAFVTGLQSMGVAACAKHFPGHGATREDSHRELPTIDVDRETLLARELVPFRAAIAAGVQSIMTAHIRVPAIDELQATLSRAHLTGLLREELGLRRDGDDRRARDARDERDGRGRGGRSAARSRRAPTRSASVTTCSRTT